MGHTHIEIIQKNQTHPTMKLYTAVLLFTPIFSKSIQKPKDCLEPSNPVSYNGHLHTTENGELCSNWIMHLDDKSFDNYQVKTANAQQNYCRFPSGKEFENRKRPWCFRETEKIGDQMFPVFDDNSWAYCNISTC